VPEKAPDKVIDEKTARPEVLPTTPVIPRPQPVELDFDEADVLFRKRTGV
jgi:hypothetical protein